MKEMVASAREDFAYKQEGSLRSIIPSFDGSTLASTPTTPTLLTPSLEKIGFMFATKSETGRGSMNKPKPVRPKADRAPRPRSPHPMAVLASQFAFVTSNPFRNKNITSDSAARDENSTDSTWVDTSAENTKNGKQAPIITVDGCGGYIASREHQLAPRLRSPRTRSAGDLRRFSFVPGDDNAAVSVTRSPPSPSLRPHGSDSCINLHISRPSSPNSATDSQTRCADWQEVQEAVEKGGTGQATRTVCLIPHE